MPYPAYRQVLQASTVHVYLTVPFVLSWSLLEAMACGALVVASDTDPVREVIDHGRHGLLTGFDDSDHLAATIGQALDDRAAGQGLRAAARRRIVDEYALSALLPRQIDLMHAVAASSA